MRVKGKDFKPREPYTHRLRKILEEYPDGSQVLREILQNSDDAKSNEQIFILDHNTYSSNSLFNIELGRYQGPALLAKNNTIFEERDFQSLLKLADSEKRDQFDKIGVMGVGFNSIYHITDSPSFITDDKFVILDPHERCFNGGVQFDFVEEKLGGEFLDQFAPFNALYDVPCDGPFNGTIFRYPLRTNEDSIESEISKKIYRPEEILDMFHKFYENEGINCLLFLKYVEKISFFELKKGATEAELLYIIQLENADRVREQRRLIAEKIIPMMEALNLTEFDSDCQLGQLEPSYVASFSRQKGDFKEPRSEWLILNYLDDLLETRKYFQEKFNKNIGDYKFVPNVGLAAPLDDLNVAGKLFCFLPLPISMPFLVSVNGYFAVSTNRRSLWSPTDDEYLASDGLARLKIEWNKYLFEKVLPKAWVKFLRKLPSEIPNIQSDYIYKFWPTVGEDKLGSISYFCKDLLQNVVENLNLEDRVFKGPNTINDWLSLSNAHLDEESLDADLLNIIGNVGFSVITTLNPIVRALINSGHRDSLKIMSPAVIRIYLDGNRDRWEDDVIPRQVVLQLFKYILKDGRYDDLEGFKMIPLANGTLGTLTQSGDSYVYIDDIIGNRDDERGIFKSQLNTEKLIDRSIDPELYERLYINANVGWNLNIKILDEIRIKDLISIIKNIADVNESKELSKEELINIIEILERIAKIQKNAKRRGNEPEILDGLLIPSINNLLVELPDICFDDMEDRLDEEERNNHIIAHHFITTDIAKALEIQTLSGKIYGVNYAGDIDWEIYEQNELLTTRISNIIQDYSLNQLFREFLQNADDAKARRFAVIIDQRQNENSKRHLLSGEMEDWQGPAIWIYNDGEFTSNDFQALVKLGIGGKSREENNPNDSKIGKFGVGFNCAFHVTDLPSLVSGKYIVFLDPHAKSLPVIEYPPRRRKGVRINFIEKEFKRSFPDQCYPYESLGIGCDFTKEFKGTLFRLPLRTFKLAEQSKISNRVLDINEILKLFNNIEGNKEMLFLRNIESCSLYNMTDNDLQLIWETNINMTDSCRNSRKKVTDEVQIYQMDMEIINANTSKKTSEIWLLCTGGHNKIKPDFEKFSKEKRLKARGGVASLLAKSEKKSVDELKAGSFPNPPALKGEMFSYLPLSISTNVGVHLNGRFTLSSARNSILQSDKWNTYILHDVLPDLHIRLLEEIVKLEEVRHMKDKNGSNFTPHVLKNLWPYKKNNLTTMYQNYCTNVVKRIGHGNHKIFWTEANGGNFVSLKEGIILEDEETIVADILAKLGVLVLKLDEGKVNHLKEISKSKEPPVLTYTHVDGKLVCQELQKRRFSSPSWNDVISGNVFLLLKLLNFILQDKRAYKILTGLPLVPLCDGSVGKFGELYYVGKQKHLDLFPNMDSSKFVSFDLPENLRKIFIDDNFSVHTKIKKFDATAILDLLIYVLPFADELIWNPHGNTIPNDNWLKKIWSKLFKASNNIDYNRLCNFPLLPIIHPSNILVRPDMENPILYKENGHPLTQALIKLKVRFTNTTFPENAHENLKKCVVKCTLINIINSLENTRSSLNLTMVQLFEASHLASSECKTFRTLIIKEMNSLKNHGRGHANFMNILYSLPIWPTHSGKLIGARSGILLPRKLPYFRFSQNTDFYNCEKKSYNALVTLGAKPISELKYIEDYMLPYLENFPTPSKAYITFLKQILSYNNSAIEQRLRSYKAIPNESLTAFARADTLYNKRIPLFDKIFSGGIFLSATLQNDLVCLVALERMGFNRSMNSVTYIKCAEEIESQIQQGNFPACVIKDRAKQLVQYLYDHINNLEFSIEQGRRLVEIKFVPSQQNLVPFYQMPKVTSGFESLRVLSSRHYKKICWTQCPLFDETVEPTLSFQQNYPAIGMPSQGDIIKHWFFVVENKSIWKSSESGNGLKIVIEEIYKIMNAICQKENLKVPIDNKKLFLNGDDVFDEKSWVAGKDLIFGLKDNNEGIQKVNQFLMPYKDLLMIAGARMLNIGPIPKIEICDQKNVILNSLLNKLINQSDNRYHDVIFIVGEEKTRIGANKYVLSAASTHLERMLFGDSNDSNELVKDEIKVPVDIKLDTFRVFLQLLYGQPFEDVTNSILRKPEDFESGQECYETYYLDFLIDLLKVTDFYGVESLKSLTVLTIINGQYIRVSNVHKILKYSEEYNAQQLKNYYKNHIKLNRGLVEEEFARIH